MTTPASTLLTARGAAIRKLTCAEALLEATPEATTEIAALLREGWQLLVAEPTDGDVELSARVAQLLPRAKSSTKAAVVAFLQEDTQARPSLELVATALGDALQALHGRPRRRFKLLLAYGLLLGTTLASAVWAYRWDTAHVWRARFFPTQELDGVTIKGTFRRLDFNWGRGAPHSDVPYDRFSARFDTCLELKKQTEVIFNVRAEDGVRLVVDEQKLINLWTEGKRQSQAVQTTLEPGRHSLRVDYFNAIGEASLTVEAGFDGGPLEVLDSRYLTLPADVIRGRCD